tara:strand:- start:840 stop:983 length:144 start_codon:yes stop_codon:yes gene_type:complete
MDSFKKSIIQYHWVLGATGFVGKHLVRELLERYQNNHSSLSKGQIKD